MSSDQAPETPTKLNDSFEFSTPQTSHKGDKSDNVSIAKLAFKTTKTPEAASKQKSSMTTDIIDVGVEQEDASGSTGSNEEWSMNWTAEGYLYYYNKVTGESQWAELDDPNYHQQQQPHYAAATSSGSELRKGQLVNGEEEEDEEGDEEDSSEDDSEYETDSDEDDSDEYDTDDDSEYDSDDTDDSELDADNDGDYDSEDDPELGTAGQRGAKAAYLEQRGVKGGVVMDGEMEANFREYMESDLGKQAMQEEQRKIERRLEKRFKAQQRKRDHRNKKSYKSKKGGNGSGRGAAGAGAGAGAGGSVAASALGNGGPLDAIGGALGSLFSGVATISGNVTAKASVVVDNYWKGKYHASWGKDEADDEGGDGSKKKKRRKAAAAGLESTPVGTGYEGARARKTAAAARGENNIIDSGDLLESAMGDGETGEEGTDYESSVESVSSNDSDVKELTAPLVPQWLQADSLRRLVGSRAVDMTHDLANKTLNSAEWLLEMTGYGVTVVGNIVWSKLNVVMKTIVDEHYTITTSGTTSGAAGGGGGGSTANTGGLPVISAPTGATTQSYLLAAPPRAPPPGRPHVGDPAHSTTTADADADSAAAVAEKKGDGEANDALEAA